MAGAVDQGDLVQQRIVLDSGQIGRKVIIYIAGSYYSAVSGDEMLGSVRQDFHCSSINSPPADG